MVEKSVKAMPAATSATVLPVDTAVEAMAELLLVTSLVMVLPRLLTVVGLRRSGPVISQCLTWGTRLLISLPSCGAWFGGADHHHGYEAAHEEDCGENRRHRGQPPGESDPAQPGQEGMQQRRRQDRNDERDDHKRQL